MAIALPLAILQLSGQCIRYDFQVSISWGLFPSGNPAPISNAAMVCNIPGGRAQPPVQPSLNDPGVCNRTPVQPSVDICFNTNIQVQPGLNRSNATYSIARFYIRHLSSTIVYMASDESCNKWRSSTSSHVVPPYIVAMSTNFATSTSFNTPLCSGDKSTNSYSKLTPAPGQSKGQWSLPYLWSSPTCQVSVSQIILNSQFHGVFTLPQVASNEFTMLHITSCVTTSSGRWDVYLAASPKLQHSSTNATLTQLSNIEEVQSEHPAQQSTQDNLQNQPINPNILGSICNENTSIQAIHNIIKMFCNRQLPSANIQVVPAYSVAMFGNRNLSSANNHVVPANSLARFRNWQLSIVNNLVVPAYSFAISVSYTHLTLPTNREV